MKQRIKYFSKATLSTALALCMLLSCMSVGLIATDAAYDNSVRVGATERIVYFTPYASGSDGNGWIKDNKKIGARYNKRGDGDWWDSQEGSDTGHTIGGKRVYQVSLWDEYSGLGNLYFRSGDNLGDSCANEIHPFSSWTAQGTFDGKYWDGDSWESVTYDTFKLRSGGNDIATFTYSSGLEYTATARLIKGTTYTLNVYDGANYWANSSAGTLSANGSKSMYRYGAGGSGDGVSITPTVTGTYSFTWTLKDKGNREDEGTLAVTFPTTKTISYTLDSNVSITSVENGTDNENGTITAGVGENVAINVAYTNGYEYDSSSSLDGATANSGYTKFTFSNIQANKTISLKSKRTTFAITVSQITGTSVSNTGGTASGAASYSAFTIFDTGTVTASPNSGYGFNGWTSESNKVSFTDSSALTTTFTATGADTIYANFVSDTTHTITVYNGCNLDGTSKTTTTYSAGTYTTPTLTAADPDDDEYSFTGWSYTGNVQLVSGYNWDDPVIKIKSTGSGNGTVTANYEKVDYIYFYAALQSNWNSNPVVTVDGAAVGAYSWIASYDNSDTPKTLYLTSGTGSPIGSNDCKTYYIGVFRVPTSKAGKNISVFNSVPTNNNLTNSNKGYIGAVQNDQGRCYYTYSTGTDQNHSDSIAPQKVTTVSRNSGDYDADNTVIISKEVTSYGATKTAGQDDFTYTYKLVDQSNNNEILLADNQPSSTNNYSFVPNTALGTVTAVKTYKAKIITKDVKTGKIINSCESATFIIRPVPDFSTVSFSQTLSGASASSAFTGSYTYKNGSATAFSSGDTLRAGSHVTLTLTLNTGYTEGTTTAKFGTSNLTFAKSYNTSTRVLTITFDVPDGGSAITVTHQASEVTHTVTVKKRFTTAGNIVTTETVATQTITGVGTATAQTVNAATAVTDYTFSTFTLPSGVTVKTGDYTTAASFTINATVDNATIFIDYVETIYTLTLVNSPSGKGTIKKSGTSNAITSIRVGNVTPVTLVATPSAGYDFSGWTAGNTVTIGTPSALTSTFRTSADATVTAIYTAVNYSIQAAANYPAGATITVTDTNGNTKGSGNIGDTFEIRITLNSGWSLTSTPISFATGTVNNVVCVAPTYVSGPTPSLDSDGYPTGGGNQVKYRYTLNAGSVIATVNLKAKTPSLSNIQIKDTSFTYQTYSSGEVAHYYKQPNVVKATTDTFSTLTYTNENATESNKDSDVEVSLNQDLTKIPTTEDGNVTYTLTVTATNDPDGPGGVQAASVSQSITIRVSFNDTQKKYFALKRMLSVCVKESASSNGYYDSTAPINAYNTAYGNAKRYIDPNYTDINNTETYNPANADYPAYNAGQADYTTANENLTAFSNALQALNSHAKTTTVYILSQFPYSSSAPINVSVTANNISSDYDHFRMYAYGKEINTNSGSITDTYHAEYYGKLPMNATGAASSSANNSNYYFLYTFKYAGHAKVQVFKGTSLNDYQMADNERISGIVSPGLSNNTWSYGDYYINLYNVSSTSTSVTTATAYTKPGGTKASGKKCVEMGQDNVTKEYLEGSSVFNFQVNGTFIDSTQPLIYKIQPSTFTVTGPKGKTTSKTYDFINGTNLVNGKFPASEQGKYAVTYEVQYGYDAQNQPLVIHIDATLYVAFDDVTIYVDMNDNVGNPVLNFHYYTDVAGGTPVEPTAATKVDAYLPYEMDLVTGSESIYKYTIKLSKLTSEYLIPFDTNSPIKISYITVENNQINNNNQGFDIDIDARVTGEVWFKADSTKFTTFETISYATANATYLAAVYDDGEYTLLPESAASFSGTGINTDVESVYNSTYAVLYKQDDVNVMKNFHYVHNTRMNQEIKYRVGNDTYTYYFDRWIEFNTPEDGLTYTTNNDGITMVSGIPASVNEFQDAADVNITKAYDYNDGVCDKTYIALYKPVVQAQDSSNVRVEITYNFQDYDTQDGNYVFDPNKGTLAASYTKTVKVPIGQNEDYATFAEVQAAVSTIASTNVPYIASNYYNYSFASASIPENGAKESESKIIVNANLNKTERVYQIQVSYGADPQNPNIRTYSGRFQQTETLKASDFTNNTDDDSSIAFHWEDMEGNVIAEGGTFNARYFYNDDLGEPEQIKLVDGSGTVGGSSVIVGSYSERYLDGTTEMLRHNFMIIDHCAEGTLVGGGVLFATGTYTDETRPETWTYRQSRAAANLADTQSITAFITRVLNNDFSTEYPVQTIENTGFRYVPNNEEIFRWSDNLDAYLTQFEGTNINSPNYENQKLRLFSFMVYEDNNHNMVIVPSEGCAEVSRYIPQSQGGE